VLVGNPIEHNLEIFVLVVSVSVVNRRGVVDIVWVRDISLFSGQFEESLGTDTIVMQYVEVGEETCRGLDNTDLEIGEHDELGIHEMVTL
jgi:hypothetical protein